MASSVSVYYEGRLESGEVVDSNLKDAEPYTFELDKGLAFPGFEEAVLALQVGEEREFHIPPEQAYGLPDDRAIQRSKKSLIKNGDSLEVGKRILMKNPTSFEPMPGLVTKVYGDFVEVDFNHPLAGKDLYYRIRLVAKS